MYTYLEIERNIVKEKWIYIENIKIKKLIHYHLTLFEHLIASTRKQKEFTSYLRDKYLIVFFSDRNKLDEPLKSLKKMWTYCPELVWSQIRMHTHTDTVSFTLF